MTKQVKDFFDLDSTISKHDENVYIQLDIDILDLYRFISWIEEEFYDKQSEYEFNQDYPQSESVELLRYQQKQTIENFQKDLMPKLWDYFLERYIIEEKEKTDGEAN